MATRTKVNFDQALASAAIDALNTLRSQLVGFQHAEDPLRKNALNGWSGPYADRFKGAANGWIPGEASTLATAIGVTIKAIEDGAAAAKAKNAG